MTALTNVGRHYIAPTLRGTNAGPRASAGDTSSDFVDLLKLLFSGRHTTTTTLDVDEIVQAVADSLDEIKTIADQLEAIKNVAALTDEEVAGLLGTSRQTLHNWRNGKKISARREQRLEKTLDAVQALGGANPKVTRRLLMAAEKGQVRIYDLFAEGNIEAARAVAGGYTLPKSQIPSEYPLATQMGLLEDRASVPRPKIDKRFSKRL